MLFESLRQYICIYFHSPWTKPCKSCSLLLLKIYTYLSFYNNEISDRFPLNGGNRYGSAPYLNVAGKIIQQIYSTWVLTYDYLSSSHIPQVSQVPNLVWKPSLYNSEIIVAVLHATRKMAEKAWKTYQVLTGFEPRFLIA